MQDLNEKLLGFLTPDPTTKLISEDKLGQATIIVNNGIAEATEKFRRVRKFIEVVQVGTGQISMSKFPNTEAVYRTKEGKFEKVDQRTTHVPLKPYVIKKLLLIPYEHIEDQMPITDLFNSFGRGLASREDKDIVETISEAANEQIDALTKGVLSVKDIINAKGKIEYPRNPALIANPLDIADLRKEIRQPLDAYAKMINIKIINTNDIPKGTAVVFDADRYSVALFERRPVTVRLFDYPQEDGIGLLATQRYVPIVLDCNKIVKIVDC